MESSKSEGDRISNVAVIGAGTMGAQIAALVAFSGRRVRLYDALPDALERASHRIADEILPGIASSGKFDGATEDAQRLLTIAPDLVSAVDGVDLVIEAVREEVLVKRGVFAELSRLAPNAILATNSSSILSADFVEAVERPERLLNMHFFAPVWIRSMLELMSCGATCDETMQQSFAFGSSIGLVTATVRGQSKGFIINRIWRAVKRESLRVVDEGVAEPEEIDRLWMIFFETRHAPFGIMDMVGLDVARDIEWSYQRDTLDPSDIPSPTLLRLIEEGKLGEKSGEGFYKHPNPVYRQPGFLRGLKTED